MILDSISVKSRIGGEAIGFDGNKKIRGRKFQIVTDTVGLIWGVRIHAANESDSVQGWPVLAKVFREQPQTARVYMDKGYIGNAVNGAQAWGIDVRLPDKGLGTDETENPPTFAEKKGFVPEATRWRVERSLAWLTRFKRFALTYERTLSSSYAFTWLAACQIALTKLVGGRKWDVKKISRD